MAGIKQPSDKSHFLLPDLGEGLAEAELISWKVKPGETVKESQTLAEMQTDKALVEVPSPWAGTVTELCGKAGDIIKVGAVLVRYGSGAPAAKSAASGSAATTAAASAGTNGAACLSSQVAAGAPGAEGDQGTVVGTMSGTLTVSDRFARRAPEQAVVVREGRALATPAVRRIARELGVDIQSVPGTGRGGRVTASDIEAFSGSGTATRGSHAAAGGAAGAGGAGAETAGFAPRSAVIAPGSVYIDPNGIAQRVPFRGVRRKIAEALDRSVRTTVHFTVVDEADVTDLDRKRREYSRVTGAKLSMLPFIMTAVCRALRKHPALNAITDDANSEILVKKVINLGCAVDTDAGLMVPNIKDADQKAPLQLADEVRRLAAACKDRSIKREDSLGGTFTISNVGSYGGMFATPVINYPEVAILAAGRAKERVLVKDGKFYAGLVLPLSLSCDHRVVDGAEGARFLNTVVTLLENPGELLG
ncbi:MAG: dihydrolipoamide acetyltransferase family protein [Phycisphaerales bacterium]